MSRPYSHFGTMALVALVGAVAAFAAYRPPSSATAPIPQAGGEVVANDEVDRSPPSWALGTPGDVGSADDTAEGAGLTLAGRVLEQIDVARYSYLRLAIEGGTESWTAVPLTRGRVGEDVVVYEAEVMTEFASTALKRTFDVIYFGQLDVEPKVTGAPDTGLSQLLLSEDGHANTSQPHPGAARDADAVPLAKSERAPAPLGRTVAELHGLDASASGSTARVRATVVALVPGVMGRTFLHLRDGSGSPPLSHDLTATTSEELTVGAEVLLEGRVELDRDFGSGYRYRVLLADARQVSP
jgi:hypothetical protein